MQRPSLSKDHALDVIRRTATMRIPTIAMSMTAPRIAEYSASAPPEPVYSAIVGARTLASTITIAGIDFSSTTSDSNRDDGANDGSHVCHVSFLPFSLFFAVCVSVHCHDQKSDNGEENEYTYQAGPGAPFGVIRDPVRFMGQIVHDTLGNRGQQTAHENQSRGHTHDREYRAVD